MKCQRDTYEPCFCKRDISRIIAFIVSIGLSSAYLPVWSKTPCMTVTESRLLNSTYTIDHHKIQLRNGKAWHSGQTPQESWDVLTGSTVVGDIDGDGRPDGAIVLMLEQKNIGPILHVAVVLERGGSLHQVADIVIGNNKYVKVFDMKITPQALTVEALDRRANDKDWEPTLPVACKFRWNGERLVNETSRTVNLRQGSFLVLKCDSSLLQKDTQSDVPPVETSESMGPVIIETRPIAMAERASNVTDKIARNACYHLEQQIAQLNNGVCTGKYQTENVMWSVAANRIALGDLNGDGRTDAVIILTFRGGGSGSFYHLIPVVAVQGQLKQVGDVSLGDRIEVNNLRIERGTIVADLTVHGPKDPMVNPTVPVKWKFKITRQERLRKLD